MQKKKVLLVPVLSLFDRIYYFSNFDVRSMSMALAEAKLFGGIKKLRCKPYTSFGFCCKERREAQSWKVDFLQFDGFVVNNTLLFCINRRTIVHSKEAAVS